MNKMHFLPAKTRKFIPSVLLAALAVAWPIWQSFADRPALRPPQIVSTEQKSCIALTPALGPYKEAVIWAPGNYCIAEDFLQQRLSDGAGHSGPGDYRHLIDIRASNVNVNISNRTLHSDGHSSGIAIGSDEYGRIKSLDNSFTISREIKISNGVIDLRGLGGGIYNLNRWRMDKINDNGPDDFEKYPRSNIILENMLILTDNISILLEGDGNIIRNCIIESGGTSTITMAGPNGRIENNTIILAAPLIPGSLQGTDFRQNRNFSKIFEARREPKAAIVLHQATGSIITGNRIEVKGKTPDRHNIYITDASKNVRIEGNTFIGTEAPVTLVKGSTAILKQNKVEPREPWWKFWPNAVLSGT